MDFFSCWKTLNERFDEGDLTAQAQLVGYKIFAIFNERMFPESLPMSDRELMSRTNIKSGQTIVAARRALKNAGLIDFTTAKNKPTRYRLTIQSSTNQARVKHESSTNQAPETNSIIRVREDVKDVKTKNKGGTRTRELSEVWVDEIHKPLGASERYELAELEEIHGYDKVKSAIEQAKKSRYYPTFNDVKKFLKGGGKLETASPSYTKPTRTGNEPWANY